jgi:CubicO group peptidase (beta-lactamase class C family)
VLALVAALALTQAVADPSPQTVDEFREAAARVLAETGVPGAGLALVRRDGVEWAGGVGFADRDRQTPVTADTRFRVGSISKTFVAMAIVQLAEDGFINLEAPVYEVAPDVDIDNPWDETHPVLVIHLLQHTAGFDDMHFNEMYLRGPEPERSLEDVLRLNPRSRQVRWPPGTRMAYSNPGYAVAGLILERTAAMPYEDYIQQEIFDPLQMTSSSFRLTADDEMQLARGYATAGGPPVGFPRIYLRPAGNMVSSAHDMARFVQMLLGWGELGDAFVIDPEYLGNMEQPRTTLAVDAGLRNGYGSGIATRLDLPYKMLGHDGGIDGFLSSYAYSPARDVGYVVLLNSTAPRAGEALRRLSRMAVSYLKRDVTPPEKPAP